jgi:hypothetical protein
MHSYYIQSKEEYLKYTLISESVKIVYNVVVSAKQNKKLFLNKRSMFNA